MASAMCLTQLILNSDDRLAIRFEFHAIRLVRSKPLTLAHQVGENALQRLYLPRGDFYRRHLRSPDESLRIGSSFATNRKACLDNTPAFPSGSVTPLRPYHAWLLAPCSNAPVYPRSCPKFFRRRGPNLRDLQTIAHCPGAFWLR